MATCQIVAVGLAATRRLTLHSPQLCRRLLSRLTCTLVASLVLAGGPGLGGSEGGGGKTRSRSGSLKSSWACAVGRATTSASTWPAKGFGDKAARSVAAMCLQRLGW